MIDQGKSAVSALRRRRDITIIAIFVFLMAAPFINKAYHIDEPYFLAVARHILIDPAHPTNFLFNWYSRAIPASMINVHPMVLPYILALFIKLTGGVEYLVRLLCLPFDMAAAVFLYLIVERFLRKPLMSVLFVLASPAYALNVHHLMGEKWIGAFGFAAMYSSLRCMDESRPGWYWASVVLMTLALMSKFTAIFLLLPVLAYALWKKIPLSRIAVYAALALLPTMLCFFTSEPGSLVVRGYAFSQPMLTTGAGGGGGSDRPTVFGRAMGPTADRTRTQGPAGLLNAYARGALKEGVFGNQAHSLPDFVHRLRSVAAFCAGGTVLPVIMWPFFFTQLGRKRWLVGSVCLMLSVLLFIPCLDVGAETIFLFDRLLGIFLAFCTLVTLAELVKSPSHPGRIFWLAWLFAVIFIQVFMYWSVVTRFTLFMAPPFAFFWAEGTERMKRTSYLGWTSRGGLAATVLLTLGLATVDATYAGAQRDLAKIVSDRYVAAGRKVWFAGHWGLQYYMEHAGAKALDLERGAWSAVHAGDVVVVPAVNTNVLRPHRPRWTDIHTIAADSGIPLRLIGYGNRQAGFYSNVFGFLPFTIGREPLDEFSIIEIRD